MKALIIAVTLALSVSAHAQTSYTVEYVRSPNLQEGCPHYFGPGCELPNQPPLTEEGCFFGERLINLFFGRPDLGQRCMAQVTKRGRYDR
jgi:hypothetical protein